MGDIPDDAGAEAVAGAGAETGGGRDLHEADEVWMRSGRLSVPNRGLSFSILSHNRGDMLLKLVDQLVADATASVEPFEIIVIDDASTDRRTQQVLADLEARGHLVVRKDHDYQMPESWAVNVTRGLARGKFDILWHFDDDTLVEGPSGWTGWMAKMLRDYPNLGTLCPHRAGIMEPFVTTPHHYHLSFGITEPCFSIRQETFYQIGGMDKELRWFFGPDYALRVMNTGLECAFWKGARQIDLCPRGGVPQDTFPRADGRPYTEKWCAYYGVGEHAWAPFVRHRARVAAQG